MKKLLRAGAGAIAICGILFGETVRAQDSIPPPLREWQGWVLEGEEFRRCPFASDADMQQGSPVNPGAFRCAWPERLNLAVDSRSGTFTQRWQVYAETWIALPGDAEFWPRDVRLNGAAAAVVSVNNTPSLLLRAGTHTVTGRFEWSSRPEALALPASSALVDLTVDGARVAQPERPGGGIWLGKRRTAAQAAAMEVQVYRLVSDEIPTYLVTQIRLNVAGDAREELLGQALPEGFTPLALTGSLPARLERDGRLRVQLRPGSHLLELTARGTDVAKTLSRPAVGEGNWPREEIWSFSSIDPLRVASAEGADGIDPAQAQVPPAWRNLPAFRMDEKAKLAIVERSRGLENADDNRLELHRNLWLDFDHDGFTLVDNVSGTLRRDWRLDMMEPFALASARQGEDQLLVTQYAEGRAGVELRQPQLRLSTVARKNTGGGSMPATGWQQRFEKVTGTLSLPPGHRLIAAIGPDAAPASWWERWGLWNVFGVALVVVFVYWTAGRIPAALAGLALVLTYQEAPGYIWLWGNLLAALAVARAAPEGDFRKFANAYRTASFLVLGVALLPFLWMQIRFALYPQLEPPQMAAWQTVRTENPYGLEALWTDGGSDLAVLMEPKAPPPPPPRAAAEMSRNASEDIAAQAADAAAGPVGDPVIVPAPEMTLDMPMESRRHSDAPVSNVSPGRTKKVAGNASSLSGLNSMQIVQRYAAGTVLQAGPGIPAWQYNSYDYYWTGPVNPDDSVRFVYVGPVSMFFWRLAGVVALVVLFLWLAKLSFGGTWRLPGRRAPAPGAATPGWVAALVVLGAISAAPPAQAQAPSNEVLQQLKSRLTRSPACAPHCATITHASIVADGDRLEVLLDVSALAHVAVALPHASDRWQLEDVSVDARGSVAIARNATDPGMWVPLTAGAHKVRLAGRLAPAESIQLAFPDAPRTIDVRARGWAVSGVNEGRLVAGSVELARERTAQRAGAELEAGSEFPAFVNVERVFNLDLDWKMTTRVVRVAPQRAALSVEIPLVTGESVLTPGLKVRNEAALVGLGAGENVTQWDSGLARTETLELTLPAGAARSEAWSFLVNPQWHVEFEGFPAVLPEIVNAPNWVFRFRPRPGEKLVVKVTRPKAVTGTTLAIDAVSLVSTVGTRLTSTDLEFTYRSTQGGQHVIALPVDARVSALLVDGQPQQLRPEKGELPLALTPGSHSVKVTWDQPGDLGLRTSSPAVNLNSAASNLTTLVHLPASRWPLFATGPGVGPAVLYWGELAVFIAIAWLLGQWSRSPLRFHEWLLLGLGLSTQSWFVFSVMAAWLVVMRWRESWVPDEELSGARFNVVQTLLAAFTLFAIALLVFSGIRNGLLSAPDMGVQGLYDGEFRWFLDQTAGAIERPTIWSVPMWAYRTLFFAWACWMAFALVRWLRWAFNAWKTNGLWK